ncbi:DUF3566 domain-containing protein [Streptomyces sp. NPDC101237]|uniref:DUF3566 domain-containing protein n=1 Tax=Streptomyces sp. NPDC101237 TaxID=3366139 RepID=UPI003828832B
MSRARRRTRHTSRKRVTPRLDDGVGTPDGSRSAAGPGNAAQGKRTGDENAAVRAAHRQEGQGRLRRGGSARTPRTPAEAAAPAEPTRTAEPAEDGTAPVGPASRPAPALPTGADDPQSDDPQSGEARSGEARSGEAPGPAPSTAHAALPPRPARGGSRRPRTMRMRISEAGPRSVTVMSFLLLGGLGILTVVASVAAWGLAALLAPDALPRLSTFLTIAFSVIVLEVVLGSCLAALTTFLYNLTAPYNGGLEISLTDDLGPTEAGAKAQLAVDRAHIRARRHLRAHTPARVVEALRRLSAGYVSLLNRAASPRRRPPSGRHPEPAPPGDLPAPVTPDAGPEE